jgi:hypothetical protein
MTGNATTMRLAARLETASLTLAEPAAAQESPAVAPATEYIVNSLSLLLRGCLVIWMAAGFAMREAGLVRKRTGGTTWLRTSPVLSPGIMF